MSLISKIKKVQDKEMSTLSDKLKELLNEHPGTMIRKELDNLINENNYETNKGEPLLDASNSRFVVLPIRHNKIWEKHYKTQLSNFWQVNEIDMDGDYNDYMSLEPDEKILIEKILAFFAASDGIVNFNLEERFTREVQILEVKVTYRFQQMMEDIHCVSGETLIMTDNGYIPIKNYVNREVNVWNGKQFSKVLVRYTGKSELYRVILSNGMCLDCTPNHKWYLENHFIKYTKYLKKGEEIEKYDLPVINEELILTNAYKQGYFNGDTLSSDEVPIIVIDKKKLKLINIFDCKFTEEADKLEIYFEPSEKKHFVPINYSIRSKLEWLSGLLDSDSCLENFDDIDADTNEIFVRSVRIKNKDVFQLRRIQILLTTLNINSTVSTNNSTDNLTASIEEYNLLIIEHGEVQKLVNFGLNPLRLKLNYFDENCTSGFSGIKISEIIKLDKIFDTYCFEERLEHSGVFNGVLTGQSETYSLLLDTLIKDEKKKKELFNAAQNVPSIKLMADWTIKWIESDKSFAHRIIAMLIVEGIFFSGAFAAIFWIKQYKGMNRKGNCDRPFMNGMVKSNKFISRDEGYHADFACDIYNEFIVNKLPVSEINEIFNEGVYISKNFMSDAIPKKLTAMNDKLMGKYIEYVADGWLVKLGEKKIYHTKNPFGFMETIGMDEKTNFHESRPTEYQSAFVNSKKNKSKVKNDDPDDF